MSQAGKSPRLSDVSVYTAKAETLGKFSHVETPFFVAFRLGLRRGQTNSLTIRLRNI